MRGVTYKTVEHLPESEVARRRADLEKKTGKWQARSLAAAFDHAAATYPDRPYILAETGSSTYAEVQAQSLDIAAGLVAAGVASGDRVALLVDNRPEYAAIKFAIARVAAIAVPLNYSYKADEIAERLAQSGASVVITIDSSVATDFLDVFDTLVPGWESGATSEDLPELRRVILVDNSARPTALDLGSLTSDEEDFAEVEARTAVIDPDSVCDIVFTSGTTGHAIGAELTHDMVLRSAYGSAYHRAFDDGWRISFALPLYHVFGYIEGMLAALFVGGAIAPLRIFNPKTVLTVIQDFAINEVLFVPTMTVAVVDLAVKESFDLSSLQSVFSAAAPAPVWLWERVLSDLKPVMVFTGYGQTEVSAATALTLPGDEIETVAGVVGTTKLGGAAATEHPDGRLAEYRTVDPFTGAPLPAGETGELSVRGPQVTRGYYRNPERTAEALDAEGWLRTGDLGRVNEQGYLELGGRSSELFKVGGELVAPVEVERVLTSIEGVSQAFVAGIPDELYGDIGWAWVVPAEGVELDPRAILAHCRQHLAAFKVPRGITVLAASELPTTTTGKVQKYLLVQAHAGD
ncbi:MAG: AMP-binding protein [Galbitalea sp.]